MMSTRIDLKNPPALLKDASYVNWKTDLEIWLEFTNLEKSKTGPAVFLSALNEKDREVVRQTVTPEVLKSAVGIPEIIKCLDKLYLKDETFTAYECYEKFEKYVRPNQGTMDDYINEFEQLYSKSKNKGMEILDGVLAYRLLNGANLSNANKQLVKATVGCMKYETMKQQLKKVFTDTDITDEHKVKTEKECYYEQSDDAYDTFYSSGYRGRGKRGNFRGRFNNNNSGRYSGNSGRYVDKNNGRGYKSVNTARKLNIKDENGDISRCLVCDSKYHWAKNCPDAYEL